MFQEKIEKMYYGGAEDGYLNANSFSDSRYFSAMATFHSPFEYRGLLSSTIVLGVVKRNVMYINEDGFWIEIEGRLSLLPYDCKWKRECYSPLLLLKFYCEEGSEWEELRMSIEAMIALAKTIDLVQDIKELPNVESRFA
jgi:hypothetical protein